jgi:RNAse (barnase) inhibitor barstar
MKTLVLDATGWQTPDDFYDAFFAAVSAPNWHGRNFNALRDSIANGSVNKVEAPYTLVVRNVSDIGADARNVLRQFEDLIKELAAKGTAVAITLER